MWSHVLLLAHYFSLLQAQWPLYCSLNTLGTALSWSLCTLCFLCQEELSLFILLCHSFNFCQFSSLRNIQINVPFTSIWVSDGLDPAKNGHDCSFPFAKSLDGKLFFIVFNYIFFGYFLCWTWFSLNLRFKKVFCQMLLNVLCADEVINVITILLKSL